MLLMLVLFTNFYVHAYILKSHNKASDAEIKAAKDVDASKANGHSSNGFQKNNKTTPKKETRSARLKKAE